MKKLLLILTVLLIISGISGKKSEPDNHPFTRFEAIRSGDSVISKQAAGRGITVNIRRE